MFIPGISVKPVTFTKAGTSGITQTQSSGQSQTQQPQTFTAAPTPMVKPHPGWGHRTGEPAEG